MEKLNKAFMKAFVDQDAESIGPMYTEDCKVMPTGQDVIVGRKGSYTIHIASYTISIAIGLYTVHY